MDATQAEAKVNQLQKQVDDDQTNLSNDQAALEQAKKELSFVNLVNSLEGLQPDDIAAINEALKEDANSLGITLSVPSTAGETAPQA